MSNNNALTQFNMDGLKKQVAESLQSAIGQFIPPAVFQGMVDEAVQAFFFETTEYEVIRDERIVELSGPANNWNTKKERFNRLRTPVTPFRLMVYRMLEEFCHTKLEEWLKQNEKQLEARATELLETVRGPMDENIKLLVPTIMEAQNAKFTVAAFEVFKGSLVNVLQQTGNFDLASKILTQVEVPKEDKLRR